MGGGAELVEPVAFRAQQLRGGVQSTEAALVVFDQGASALLESRGRTGGVGERAELGEALGQHACAGRARVEGLPVLGGDQNLLFARQCLEVTEQAVGLIGAGAGGIHGALGDAAGPAVRIGLVLAQHFGPAVAQLPEQPLDLMDGFWALLEVGLEQSAQVIVVESSEVRGVLAAGLVIEIGLELDENVLGAQNRRIDVFDAPW